MDTGLYRGHKLGVKFNVAWWLVFDDLDARAEGAGIADSGSSFDTVGFGLVAGRNAAGRFCQNGGNSDRFASQMGVEMLFNRGEIGIEVNKERCEW
jgi:hypothetical protein